MEKNHITIELIPKTQPDSVRSLGEKSKLPPTGKFIAHAIKGTVNSNSLINPSYRKDDTCLRGLEWFPRR